MSKQEGGYRIRGNSQIYQKTRDHGNEKILHFYERVEESITPSQDFCLRLSEGSNQTDACDDIVNCDQRNDEGNVILISDSSSDSFSPKFPSKGTYKSKKTFTQDNGIYVLESSDSESSSMDDGQVLQAWNAQRIEDVGRYKQNIVTKKKDGLFSSDEFSSSSSENSKKHTHFSSKSDSSHISPTPQIIESGIQTATKIIPTINNKYASTTNSSSSRSASTNSSDISNRMNKIQSPGNTLRKTDRSNGKNKLTKKDTYNILKNIKSTRAVYESPIQFEKNNVIIDESIDDGDIHPAISPTNDLKTRNVFIDESLADSDSDIIHGSQVNLANPYKTHVSRFLDAPDTDKNENKTDAQLSEQKKKQISQWLMATSPDSISDSSFSNVPPSNRTSVSSGNSSLERLEMNYETPNNRGKISRVPAIEKGTTVPDCNKVVNSTVSRQATLHNYVEKSKDDTFQFRTPTNSTKNMPVTTSAVNTPQNLDIANCAHILDKLYGNVWREKADVLLPTSEPRKQVVPAKNRVIQTERKVINKKNSRTAIPGKAESNIPLQNPKPQQKSVKKSVQRNHKQRDSFINDDSSSDSGRDSSYYTALTNPRTSTNSAPSKTTSIPRTVERVLSICDSDSESEDGKSSTNQRIDIARRRRLSFSDDEDEGSSTSEFDPGDNIPPKSTSRKERLQTPRQISKPTGKIDSASSNNQKYQKQNSFLSSLSENVPITNAHPDAKKYRTDYKNSKENLCQHLFKLYNEKVFDKKLPEDMLIEWNVRMRGTAGFCYNKRSIKTLGGVVKSSRIVLATKVLDTPDRLRDTLIHEMCHAAAWLINDVSDGHGQFWTAWANKAMRTFPELPPIRRCHDYKIKTKFTYRCVGCGYSIGRHSKSLDVERKRCGHCYGKFELLLNKSTKSGIVQVQTPKREPSAFALYVKENYSSIKKERNIKHADVMKLLGQQFSAIKIAKKAQGTTENDSETPG